MPAEPDFINHGLVIKSYCGYFHVHCSSVVYRCKTRGRVGSGQVMVGDNVAFSVTGDGEGIIEDIKPRGSVIKKPPVANIDQIVLVFSMNDPAYNLRDIDNFLLMAGLSGIKSAICMNKRDLAINEEIYKLQDIYKPLGIEIVFTSARDEPDISSLKEILKDHISVFTGPSGVGKSSLLNVLKKGLNLKTADVSAKIKRGQHTTRFVELVDVGENTWVVDTPGFSLVENNLEPRTLQEYFSEIDHFGNSCRFKDCLHIQEPECKVKEAVEDGAIAKSRYGNYCAILEELTKKERNKYR